MFCLASKRRAYLPSGTTTMSLAPAQRTCPAAGDAPASDAPVTLENAYPAHTRGATFLSQFTQLGALNSLKIRGVALATLLHQSGAMRNAWIVLPLLMVVAGCGSNDHESGASPGPDAAPPPSAAPHPEPCAAGEFNYSDKSCGPFDTSNCRPMGDGWCYTNCEQGSTCAGGFVCTGISLFEGNDTPQKTAYVCDGPLSSPVGGDCRSSKDCGAQATCAYPASADRCDASCASLACQPL
jgi:hypothetical protein